jgi:hypothetical protein
MSEPAKDEAELLTQVARATCECQPGGCFVRDGGTYCYASEDDTAKSLAAIRAAGWEVVPALRLFAINSELRAENARLRTAIRVNALRWAPHLSHAEIDAIVAAAPGVKP